MKRRTVLLAVLAVGFLTLVAHAGAKFINYQSILSDDTGPLSEVTLDITFRLYDSEVAVEPLWWQTFTGVITSKKGKISLKLGKDKPLPDSAFDKDELWLGITIEGDPGGEMVPRTELGAAPFAFHAKTVPDKSIGKNKLDTLSVDSSKIADKAIRKENIKDKAIDSTKIDDKAIRKENIKDKAIDSTKIADKAIRKENIKDKTVDSTKIDDKAIRKENLKDKAIDSTKIADNGIHLGNIAQNDAMDGYVIKWSGARAGWTASPDDVGTDDDWDFNATNTALVTGGEWGIVRKGSTTYGQYDSTHVNLGVGSTTGRSGYHYKYAAVGGGQNNTAGGFAATVSGGQNNSASNYHSSIAGGLNNNAEGSYSSIAGGASNNAEGSYSAVGGGFGNHADSQYSAIGGGVSNQALGRWSTIGGGVNNSAGAYYSTIGGGLYNRITSFFFGSSHSTIGGGDSNSIGPVGNHSTVGGGHYNFANGSFSTIPGGRNNTVCADNSFAAGTLAKALHSGSFVIASNNGLDALNNFDPSDSVWTDRGEQMVLRADSGFFLTDQGGQAYNGANRWLNTSTGGYLNNAGVWMDNSDRDKKENFVAIDGRKILERLATLPITQWNYRIDGDDIQHIGPVAQDFYAVFGLGNDDKAIAPIDEAGIALAAIQELHKKTQKIDELEAKVAELEKLVRQLMAQNR